MMCRGVLLIRLCGSTKPGGCLQPDNLLNAVGEIFFQCIAGVEEEGK